MHIDVRPAAGDIIQEAFVCVVGADVVARSAQRWMMARLVALKAARGCPPAACGGCARRADCEARVTEIIGGRGGQPCDDDHSAANGMC